MVKWVIKCVVNGHFESMISKHTARTGKYTYIYIYIYISVHCHKWVSILIWPKMLPGCRTPTTNIYLISHYILHVVIFNYLYIIAAVPLINQAIGTMTQYSTQSHYPDTDWAMQCPILLMMNARVGTDKYQFYKSCVWLDWKPNYRLPMREACIL